jgi:protein TonB
VTEKVVEKPKPVQEAVKLNLLQIHRQNVFQLEVQVFNGVVTKFHVSQKIYKQLGWYIEADEKGKITNGTYYAQWFTKLDEKALRAVRSAKFKPYMENGVAYPIKAEQPFELTL